MLSCQRVLVAARVGMISRSVGCAMRSAAIVARLVISRRYADSPRNLMGKRVRQAAVAKAAANVARIAAMATRATAVDNLDIEDLIALMCVVVVESEVT